MCLVKTVLVLNFLILRDTEGSDVRALKGFLLEQLHNMVVDDDAALIMISRRHTRRFAALYDLSILIAAI